MNATLEISVIIPSFNSGRFLIDAVESINCSAKQPKEVIIVDDCSTDNISLEIAKSLAIRFQNIILIQASQNVGAMHARKIGIDRSSCEYLFFLDADDFLESDALDVAFNSLDGHDACLLDQWIFSDIGSSRDIDISGLRLPLSGRDAGALTLNGWQIHTKAVFKKNIYESVFHKINHLNYANVDEVLSRYIIASTSSFTRCGKRYMVRINPGSTTRSLSKKTISVAYCFKDIYYFSKVYGYLNTSNHYEGYIFSDAIRFFWFLRRNKKVWKKMEVWNCAQHAIRENLHNISLWPEVNVHFWKIKKSLFFKIKIFVRYRWMMLFT